MGIDGAPSASNDLAVAARRMLENDHKWLPVADGGRGVGLASRHDVLRPSRPLTVGQIEEMLEPTAWAPAPTGPVLTAA